jgi:hypothetical protein
VSIADLAPGQHAVQVRDHWWWRPGWRPGRHFYAYNLTLSDQPALHRLAGRYRSALKELPDLTLIPDQWLHLTMQGLGFVDDISPTTLDQVTASVEQALATMPTFDVTFRDAVVGDEAIALPAEPAEPIQELRTSVRRAIGGVLGPDQVEGASRYRPHVSVAYLGAPGSAQPYVTAVRSVAPEQVQARLSHVDLIRMNRDQHMYEWDTLAQLPLA